jgi:hypothetical protein
MIDKYLNEIHEIEEIKRQKHLKEKENYEILTPEEKLQRLMDGLYNY